MEDKGGNNTTTSEEIDQGIQQNNAYQKNEEKDLTNKMTC